MVFILNPNRLDFPSGEYADENGIVAVGGDFSGRRLLAAYKQGIFPWPCEQLENLWFCPSERFVLPPQKIRLNKSLKKTLINMKLEIRFDTNFAQVIKNCQSSYRKDQGTWITNKLINGFLELHAMGYAHSVEAYYEDELVGGLYGVAIGDIFCGESMFQKKSNASKVCFAVLAAHLKTWGFSLIDCQSYTDTLANFGAAFIPRLEYLRRVKVANKKQLSHLWKVQIPPKNVAIVIET